MQALGAALIAVFMAVGWPLVKKVLIALGIGALTYGGLTLVGNQIKDVVIAQWGAMPASFLQIATLSGVTDSVGIMLGAIAARISLVAIGKIGKVST